MLIVFLIAFLLWPITPYAADTNVSSPVHADYIRIVKSRRMMFLYSDGRVIRKYRIALGRNPVGPKLKEGDGRTPEGRYIIDSRNPASRFHLALHISYPNEIDSRVTKMAGNDPGGGIFIHGTGEKYAWMGKYHVLKDWTEGCIAVTNEEIEEIWRLVPDGTTVDIVP
jgi:murein L,D-transpeptidase YafK